MTYGTANIDAMATSTGQILGAGNSTAFKNRIINGAMVIDQRNAGASVTVTSGYTGYAVDRFRIDPPVGQSITGQQVTASLSGFQNALTYTAGTGSTNASDQSEIVYFIEGYNVADLQFGTANAQTITLSFWAKSSLSGTFGLVLENNDRNRAYVTSYSLPTTNTWTYITKTIVGDTSGTWLYTNGRGIGIRWDMGAGTTYSGAVTNAWGASPFIGITAGAGVVKLTQNTGATFTITGVQLEVGTQATSFDYRDYTRELQMCQRYLPAWRSSSTQDILGNGAASGSNFYSFLSYETAPRIPPTGITYSSASHFYANQYGSGGGAVSNVTFNSAGSGGIMIVLATSSMTSGSAGNFYFNSTQGYIYGTGCEL